MIGAAPAARQARGRRGAHRESRPARARMRRTRFPTEPPPRASPRRSRLRGARPTRASAPRRRRRRGAPPRAQSARAPHRPRPTGAPRRRRGPPPSRPSSRRPSRRERAAGRPRARTRLSPRPCGGGAREKECAGRRGQEERRPRVREVPAPERFGRAEQHRGQHHPGNAPPEHLREDRAAPEARRPGRDDGRKQQDPAVPRGERTYPHGGRAERRRGEEPARVRHHGRGAHRRMGRAAGALCSLQRLA